MVCPSSGSLSSDVAGAIAARQAQFPTIELRNQAVMVITRKLAIHQNTLINYDKEGKVQYVGK